MAYRAQNQLMLNIVILIMIQEVFGGLITYLLAQLYQAKFMK